MSEYEGNRGRYGLFEVFGIELEYMIVDRETLNIRPIADLLLRDIFGKQLSEKVRGPIVWSNELARHVLEFKVGDPVDSLTGVESLFMDSIRAANVLLEDEGAILLPSSAHPWMNPELETELWPFENREIYDTFDRIFNCRRHGWANLQSMHINLPFKNDSEFFRLHEAIRIILPLLPAIAASSPVLDGKITGWRDARLREYRGNAAKMKEIAGDIIPELLRGESDYEGEVYDPLRNRIGQIDPDGVLEEVWVNSRGAIARFDRGSIEIRLIDIQENPSMDLAIAGTVVAVLRWIVEKGSGLPEFSPVRLLKILEETEKDAGDATIVDHQFLHAFGIDQTEIRAKDLWKALLNNIIREGYLSPEHGERMNWILEKGTLSDRILKALARNPDDPQLFNIYRRLTHCLNEGEAFDPDA